jgi:hypothetical protein
VHALVFSADGRLVASGELVRDIDVRGGTVRALAFSADSACVLAGCDDLGHWLWTIDSGEGIWIPARHLAPIDSMRSAPPPDIW